MFQNTKNLVNAEFTQKLASLYSYLASYLHIKQTPKVVLTNSKKNSTNPFGMTGYYDHESKSIRLYITDRHPTDILRSFAHEVIHHWQNESGTLHPDGDPSTTNTESHYAQEDQHLRKKEMEAYLFGNILFRDWQDQNRYGPPKTPPLMPQPINENLTIKNSQKIKEEFKNLLNRLVQDGTLTSFHRDLTSGDMNAADFVEDFANKLVGSFNQLIQTINDRSNWESQPDMIQEDIKLDSWVDSMVGTVEDYLVETGDKNIDVYTAYDILKTNFRADAPSRELFDVACKRAIEKLKQMQIVI